MYDTLAVELASPVFPGKDRGWLTFQNSATQILPNANDCFPNGYFFKWIFGQACRIIGKTLTVVPVQSCCFICPATPSPPTLCIILIRSHLLLPTHYPNTGTPWGRFMRLNNGALFHLCLTVFHHKWRLDVFCFSYILCIDIGCVGYLLWTHWLGFHSCGGGTRPRAAGTGRTGRSRRCSSRWWRCSKGPRSRKPGEGGGGYKLTGSSSHSYLLPHSESSVVLRQYPPPIPPPPVRSETRSVQLKSERVWIIEGSKRAETKAL